MTSLETETPILWSSSSTDGEKQKKHIPKEILLPELSTFLQYSSYSHSYALFNSECCVLQRKEATRIQMTENSSVNAEGKVDGS